MLKPTSFFKSLISNPAPMPYSLQLTGNSLSLSLFTRYRNNLIRDKTQGGTKFFRRRPPPKRRQLILHLKALGISFLRFFLSGDKFNSDKQTALCAPHACSGSILAGWATGGIWSVISTEIKRRKVKGYQLTRSWGRERGPETSSASNPHPLTAAPWHTKRSSHWDCGILN